MEKENLLKNMIMISKSGTLSNEDRGYFLRYFEDFSINRNQEQIFSVQQWEHCGVHLKPDPKHAVMMERAQIKARS